MAYRYQRNLDAGEFFESFLVAAVAAILSIRVFLHLAGYPKLGGDALHVAHMLWGGLLMLAALIMLLGFLGNGVRHAAAVVGGLGFGTFIDELGKFLTHDNDYFFEPAPALIYLVFVATYVTFHQIHGRRLTDAEAVANALEILQDALRHDLDPDERARATGLLQQGDRDSPLVIAVDAALAQLRTGPGVRPGLTGRARQKARSWYGHLVRRPWFAGAVIAFFVGQSVVALLKSTLLVTELSATLLLLIGSLLLAVVAIRAHRVRKWSWFSATFVAASSGVALLALGSLDRIDAPALTLFQWGEVASSVIAGGLVLLGVYRMGQTRLAAYYTFKRAVLFLIFVGQFFAFYHAQFLAVTGLFLNILILGTLRYMIHQEELRGTGPVVLD